MIFGYEKELGVGLCLIVLLYAETHYSFKGIYSRLKKKEPEIIADLPHRLQPNAALPLLILVKDADKFPIRLQSIQAELSCGSKTQSYHFDLNSLRVNEDFWYQIFELPPPKNFAGKGTLDVKINYSINGQNRTAKNDNYTGTGHAPFKIHLSDSELPKTTGWHFGEFHCHTNYTSDQVEFGAPLAATKKLAQALGLSFFCATDHSYDLDDEPHNYLKYDPNLTKWRDLQNEVKSLNDSNSDFVIVPGEEVSAGNGKNQNVHFLILNHPNFLPGDGDSAEKWLQTKPNLSISEIIEQVNSNALTFAAHPGTKPPLLERLLIRRGKWHRQDCDHAELNGLQIWNGVDEGFNAGKEMWIELLLQGRRVFISGGNDAHGNFNRFRQIGLPFFTMRENHEHLFGKVRTGVYLDQKLSLNSLLRAFKNGRMIVTDGPFAEMTAEADSNRLGRSGDAISGKKFRIALTCLSTTEFGRLHNLKIYRGNLSEKKERLLKEITNFSDPFNHSEKFEIGEAGPTYLRAELYSNRGKELLKCLTNPIWLNAVS